MGLIRSSWTAPLERSVIDISEDNDLSLPIDIRQAAFGGLIVPDTVNGTEITFLVAAEEDGTYVPLTDGDNSPIALAVTSATASGPPLPPELFAHNFFKIKTTTAQTTTDTQFLVELKG